MLTRLDFLLSCVGDEIPPAVTIVRYSQITLISYSSPKNDDRQVFCPFSSTTKLEYLIING